MGRFAHSREVTATYTPKWEIAAIASSLVLLTIFINWLPVIAAHL